MQFALIIAALAGLSSNLSNFFIRHLLRGDEDTLVSAWGIELFRVIVFGILLLFELPIHVDKNTLLLLLGMGIFEIATIFTYMKMHEYNELSVSSIVYRARLIFTPILAFFFLKEALNLHQYLGILILFVGVSIVVSPKKFLVDKGVNIAMLSAISVSIMGVLIKIASASASIGLIVFVLSLPSVIVMPLIMKQAKKRLPTLVTKNFSKKLLLNFFNLLAFYGFILAIKHGQVSIVTAIYQGMFVIAVILGIVFLHERKDIGKKLIGSIVAILGIVILTNILGR